MFILLLISQLGLKSENLLALPAPANYLFSAETDSISVKTSADKMTPFLEWTTGTVCGALSCYLIMPKNDEPWDKVLDRTLAMIPISTTVSCVGIHTAGDLRKKERSLISAFVGEVLGLGLSMLFLGKLSESTQEKLLKYPIVAATVIYAAGSAGGVLGYNWEWRRTEE